MRVREGCRIGSAFCPDYYPFVLDPLIAIAIPFRGKDFWIYTSEGALDVRHAGVHPDRLRTTLPDNDTAPYVEDLVDNMVLSPKTYTFLCGCFAALGSILFGYVSAAFLSFNSFHSMNQTTDVLA